MKLLLGILMLFGGVHIDLNDNTPGVLCSVYDSDFRGYFYPEKVVLCKRHLTARTKRMVAERYDIAPKDYKYYEFDHYIPVALGGSNNGANIWPQLLSEAHEKDVLEVRLYHALKKGTITQKEAVSRIMAWRHPVPRRAK
jgi:hypothetical protein